MKFTLRTLTLPAILSAVMLLSSCNRDPVACFNKDKSILEVGETVNFTNCSFLGSTYDWDFGDGLKSTNKEPAHTYDSAGFFQVSMIVTTKNGKASSEVVDVVTVGYRMIQEIQVIGLPSVDGSGNGWDAGDGADVQLVMREGNGPGSNWEVITLENTDLADPAPFTWIIAADKIPFTNATWYYELRDNDGGGTFQVMSSGTFQPYTDDVDGTINIVDGNTSMRFTWEIGY